MFKVSLLQFLPYLVLRMKLLSNHVFGLSRMPLVAELKTLR